MLVWSVTTHTMAQDPTAVADPRGGDSATLALVLAGDAYEGPPEFVVSFAGKVIGGGKVTSAFVTETEGGFGGTRDLVARSETFSFALDASDFTTDGIVEIGFTNDAVGDDPALDRNLYVLDVAVNGVSVEPVNLRHRNKATGADHLVAPPYVALFSSNDAAIALPPPDGWPPEPAD